MGIESADKASERKRLGECLFKESEVAFKGTI